MAGSIPFSNLDGTGGVGSCVVIVGTAAALESIVALGEGSGRRNGTPTEEIEAGLSSSVRGAVLAVVVLVLDAYGVAGDANLVTTVCSSGLWPSHCTTGRSGPQSASGSLDVMAIT